MTTASAPPIRPGSGLIIGAPQSGSGKTSLTLSLLRAFSHIGISIASAKAGPDYIDPRFHEAACGGACVSLDPWAMRPELVRALVARQAMERPLLIESMMGLFDGAADGSGSAADLAAMLGLPVLLVIDASKQSHSIAALAKGFRDHRAEVALAGIVLNKVASPRHETMLRAALDDAGILVLGAVPRDPALALPERYLGLVQAGERADLEDFVEKAAGLIARSVDLEAVAGAFAGNVAGGPDIWPSVTRPPGQRVAVARDIAFAFTYPHMLDGWRQTGAELSFFSPLANEAPAKSADAVYLPGGYPELHAGRLAGNLAFIDGLQNRAAGGAVIFGECGGFMVLGEALVDKGGRRHKMAGLLPLVSSFEPRKLHLGYRRAVPLSPIPLLPEGCAGFTAHEFHYASALEEGGAEPLFAVEDAMGNDLGTAGLRRGSVMGSFIHLIDVRQAP